MAILKPITKSDYLVTLVTDSNSTVAQQNGDLNAGGQASGDINSTPTPTSDNVATKIWTSCSAFKFSNATSKYNDGQSYIMKTVAGPTEYDDITLSRPYDPALHGDFLQMIAEVQEQGKVFTLTITPGKKTSTSEGFVPNSPGRRLTLIGCELVSFSMYDADGASGDASVMELVIAPNGHVIEGVNVGASEGTVQQDIGNERNP